MPLSLISDDSNLHDRKQWYILGPLYDTVFYVNMKLLNKMTYIWAKFHPVSPHANEISPANSSLFITSSIVISVV